MRVRYELNGRSKKTKWAAFGPFTKVGPTLLKQKKALTTLV